MRYDTPVRARQFELAVHIGEIYKTKVSSKSDQGFPTALPRKQRRYSISTSLEPDSIYWENTIPYEPHV